MMLLDISVPIINYQLSQQSEDKDSDKIGLCELVLGHSVFRSLVPNWEVQ